MDIYKQRLIFMFCLLFVSIVAQENRKKTCLHNISINGTNLIALYRKRLLVLGIINLNNQSSRIQANSFIQAQSNTITSELYNTLQSLGYKFNDLYRELQNNGIRESTVRLILVNEADAINSSPGKYYDKIRLFQDTLSDGIIKKIRHYEKNADILMFGRCGYLGFTQQNPHSNLQDGKNYKELLQNIKLDMRNKRRCQRLCS